jgi:hypothetical protein
MDYAVFQARDKGAQAYQSGDPVPPEHTPDNNALGLGWGDEQVCGLLSASFREQVLL